MRVIHGIWAHGALCLWAEDPDLPPVGGGPRRRRPAAAAASVRLPGRRAGRHAGRRGPGPASGGDAARKAVHDELTLQLPSAGGGPLASPELVRPGGAGVRVRRASGRPARRGRVSLASWRVPVLAFGPAAALAVLGGVPASRTRSAAAGGSLPYLAAVARFAADLAARGRVLPVLAAEGETYAARWRPVLGGADAQRARDLAAAMPPSCRAVCGRGPGAAARQRPGCPGRRRRAGPAARLAAARPGAAAPRRAFRWPNGTCWP